MSDLYLRALMQALLGGATSMEDQALLAEVCRRVILSGINFSSLGALNLGIPSFGPSVIANLGATGVIGDIPYYDSTTTLARLAGGAANTLLKGTGAGSIPAYSKLVNADVDNAAAIAYSKLNLATSIVNADVALAAAIAWSKIDKAGSSLADLATRSAADLSSGILLDARLVGVIVAAALGAVGTPSHTFSGDLNTGMYSPGADQLDLATAGVKALGIDATQFIDSPTQPRCLAYNNAVQSVNNATVTALTLNAEDYDVGTMHDTAVNNTRITVPTGGDGLYFILGGTLFDADVDGYRQLDLRKNGTTDMATIVEAANTAGASTGIQISAVLVLVAGDYIELRATHTAGAALNVGSASRAAASFLNLVKLW